MSEVCTAAPPPSTSPRRPHLSRRQAEISRIIAQNVRAAMERAGLDIARTSQVASTKLDAVLSPATLGHICRGTHRVTVDQVWALAQTLQVPMSDLLPGGLVA